MLRNAQRDQRLMLIMVIINVGNVVNLGRRWAEGSTLSLLYVIVALMILFVSWITYRQRQLIRQLRQGDGATYGHLREAVRQLRVFSHNKLYAKIAFLTTIFLVLVYGKFDAIRHSLQSGLSLTLVAWGVVVGLGLVVLLLYVGQRRQQRRYGRYLDQLEGALRELEEPK
jgi:Flp pilus assembly protein TadB